SADVIYRRAFRAANDSLRFSAQPGTPLAIRGFSGTGVAIYDVTNPAVPHAVSARVMSAVDGYVLLATAPGKSLRQLLAVGPGGYATPDSIQPVSQMNLMTGGANYVVVAYDSMLPAAQQLAALRTAEGLSTQVVPVSAVYDAFGTGVPDADAIAAFVRQAASHWSPAPQYMVLLGSASYDSHNYLGLGNQDLVPTGYAVTRDASRTASDVVLAGSNGSSPVLMALGRLPARTPAEATALVNKLIAYSTTNHQWTGQVALVADQDETLSFNTASESLAGTLGTLSLDRVYQSIYGANTGTQIVNSLNAGRALVNYYGHASFGYWGADHIFNSTYLSQVNNTGHEAFVTSMTCFAGDYDRPQGDALASQLLLKTNGGAIGVLAATGVSIPDGQHEMNTAFYAGLLSGQRVGDAFRAGQAATLDAEVVVQFNLLGDPAQRVDLGQ
ncbi:MAG TPA: C25 family cysteine peptidase, partial [Chloroflexia bacterium]|nr:C25 family cysteine peptidase [Chloroflexia bacterium]